MDHQLPDAPLPALDSMLDNPQSWDDTALLITKGLLQHFISFALVTLSNKICNNNLSFSGLCRTISTLEFLFDVRPGSTYAEFLLLLYN